jgi:hypothetical protein
MLPIVVPGSNLDRESILDWVLRFPKIIEYAWTTCSEDTYNSVFNNCPNVWRYTLWVAENAVKVKINKVKLSPWQTLETCRVVRYWGSHIPTVFRQSSHWWRWGFSLTCRPHSAPQKCFSVSGSHFCLRMNKRQGLVWPSGDLPTCSMVPQPTTLPRAPENIVKWIIIE